MDIVERLRLGDFSLFSGEYIKDADKDEAADEIERLREELKFTDEVRQSALQSLFSAENKLEIREGQFRGALGELIRTRQQNVELVEALEIAANGFMNCGAEDLEDMCRAAIAKATGEK